MVFEDAYAMWTERRLTQERDAELQLGEEQAAGAWEGGTREGPGEAREAPRAGAAARDDAAPGRQHARAGAGVVVGPGGDDGRRDERALLDVPVRGGEDLEQLPRGGGDDPRARPVLLAVHGPGVALLDDAGGGREGRQGEPHPVR